MASVVLYVDDEPVPGSLGSEIERRGHGLVHTQDPEEALSVVASGEAVLVFLEPLLAGCDGFGLLQSIGSAQPDLPVVVVTRGQNPRLYPRAVEAGCRDFLTKPVLSSQLLACVYDLAGQAPERPVDTRQEAAAPPGVGPEPARAAEALSFAELLQQLHEGGFSGVVIVSCGDRRTGVELRNGTPVAASTKAGRERLEDYLLRCGRISQEQHDRLVDQIAGGVGRVEELLVGTGMVSEHDIQAARAEQGREILVEPFGWLQGSHRLLPGKRLKADTALPLDCSAPAALLQGGLACAAPAQVSGWLDRSRSLYVSEAPSWEQRPLALSPEQRALVKAFQGDRTLAEIVAAGEAETRLLYALALAGALELHTAPTMVLSEALVPPAPAPEAEAARPAPRAARRPAPVRTLRERVRAAEPARREAELARRIGELRGLAEQLADRDAFRILEVSEDSADEDVHAAYRAKVALDLLTPPAELASDPALSELISQVRDRFAQAYRQLRTAGGRRVQSALLKTAAGAEPATAARALQAEGWFRKGAAALEERDYAKAVEALGMAAHLDPQQGEYLAHLGYALFLSNPRNNLVGREAMEHMAKGIKLSPDRPLSYVFLGRALATNDDVENARRMFRRALKIDPDFHPARQELRLLEMRGQKAGLLGRLRRS